MNIWQVLGISETKDKDELKKAYRVRLNTVNPEDDPEGFMQLREAYEEAVRLADSDEREEEDTQEEELTGVELDIDEIYKDFNRRIDVDSWKELFASDYFVALETSTESFEKLMVYVMNHYCLPDKVFKLLVETFDIEGRRQELGEIFPDDFLNFIINNAKYEDVINYYAFEGDLSFADEFIGVFYALKQSILRRDYDTAEEYFEKIYDMPISNPSVDVLRIQMELLIIREKYEEENIVFKGEDADRINIFKADISKLLERLPEDNNVLALHGDLEIYTGNYEAAKEVFEHILKNNPRNIAALDKMADLHYRQGEYEASRDMYMELVQINPYDSNPRAGMYRANMGIIEAGKKTLEHNPDDHGTMQEMAWSYYQNFMFDEGIALLSTFEPTEEESYQYYNVKGRMYIESKNYREAMKCFLNWKMAIEKLINKGDNLSKDEYEKKKRYPYVKSLLGECYMNLGMYDEGRDILYDALNSDYDEKVCTYETLCELLYRMEQFDECIRECDTAIAMQPDNHLFHMIKAKACYEQEYLRDAMEECGRTIAIFPYAMEAYVYKIKIYQWVEQYDDADAVIEQYLSLVPASETMKYYRALNLKYQDKDKAALKILEELKELHNSEETDIEDYPKVLCLLADMYDDMDMNQKAIDVYREVLDIAPEHMSVHAYLGYMYKKIGEYELSIEEYNKQIEIRPHANHFFHRAMAFKRLHRPQDAIKDLETAVDMDPQSLFNYYQLGQIYYTMCDFEHAAEWYGRGIDVATEDKLEQKLEMIRWKARALACIFKYEESTKLMQETLDTYGDENDYDVRYELALTYTRMDRFDLARKILEEYIENGDNEDEKFSYISLLMELTGEEGCLEESRELYKKATALRPEDKKIHGLMGRIFSLNKCYEEARIAFEKSMDEGQTDSDNYYCEYLEMVNICEGSLGEEYNELIEQAKHVADDLEIPKMYIKLARLYRALKDYDKALEWVNRAISSQMCFGCGYGCCEEGYLELGITYQQMGDIDKARAAFEKAIEVHGHCGIYDVKLAECN